MLFPRRLLVAVFAILLVCSPLLAAAVQQQRSDPPPTPIELARAGKATEAWAQWNKLPAGADKLRSGVELAGETREIARGLTLYDQLTRTGATVDPPSLTHLATGTAKDLLTGGDVTSRARACSGALILNPAHAPCLQALSMMAQSPDATEMLEGVAALANAGFSVYTTQLLQLELRPLVRLRLAQTMTRLPSAVRVDLLRPLFKEQDPGLKYQTLLALADIPGLEPVSAIREIQATGAIAVARTVALARHGDPASVTGLRSQLDNMDAYLKVQAARALLSAGDAEGTKILTAVAKGPVDLDRIHAAEALATINPNLARDVLVAALSAGSQAVRPAAIQAAGVIGLGSNPIVYRSLTAGTSELRSLAVVAIADTLSGRSVPRHP